MDGNDPLNQGGETQLWEAYRDKVALIRQDILDSFVPRMKAIRRAEASINVALYNAVAPHEAEMEGIAAEFAAANPQPPEGTADYIAWNCKSAEYVGAIFNARHPDHAQAIETVRQDCAAAMEKAGDLGDLRDEFIAQGGTQEQWNDLDQAVLLRVFSHNPQNEVPQRALTHPGEIVEKDVLPALGLDFAQAASRLSMDAQRFQQFLGGEVDVTVDEAREIETQFADAATGTRFDHALILRMQQIRAAHKLANPQFYP